MDLYPLQGRVESDRLHLKGSPLYLLLNNRERKPHTPQKTAPKARAERQSRSVVTFPSMFLARTSNAEESSNFTSVPATKPTADLLTVVCSLENDTGENEKFIDTLSAAVIALILWLRLISFPLRIADAPCVTSIFSPSMLSAPTCQS